MQNALTVEIVMENTNIIDNRLRKLHELKQLLSDIDDKLLDITKEFNWDHKKLLEEVPSNMVTCSVNSQHRVPIAKIKTHEQKCSLHQQGYSYNEKFFPDHSGVGSYVTLTSETLHSITENVTSYTGSELREVPQTSANLDQNFNREEKLAIYDYVIANTQKQNSYSDLWLQPIEKREEKREMTAWEIAAAERDAKRRRASYRNKVHTNRKTHTEILREVIEAQMEAFKEERIEKTPEKTKRHKTDHKKSSHESKDTYDKHKSRYHETSSRGNKEERDKRRNHEKHSKHRDHKRSPPVTGNDIKSRSRSHDKYRKWKSYEGRSHSHRSSHTHRR